MNVQVRNRVSTRAALAVILIFLHGCAGRPDPTVLESITSPVPPGVRTVRVYAATTRGRVVPTANRFSDQFSLATSYASFDVSVPPDHRVGQIEWPKGKPDSRNSFAVRKQAVLDQSTFLDAVVRAPLKGDTGVFVHGYNTSFEEGVFRLAQMAADSDLGGVPILFAWPSQAALTGYLTDKEAATASRDNLVALLSELTDRRKGKDITVFSHSMGAWLLMEALRQLKLQGRDDVLARLRVFLASPDIDESVFQAQLAVIGKMRKPITIFVSKDDVALRLSGFLTGNRQRLGALDVASQSVIEASRRNGVQIVDISQLDARDRLRHDRYAALAGIRRAAGGTGRDRSILNEAGAFVLNISGAILSAPPTIAGTASNQ